MASKQTSLVPQGTEPGTVAEKSRQCPFYGMNIAQGVLTDTRGNQCAIETGRFSPCHLEMRGEAAVWERCPYRRLEESGKFLELLRRGRAFPDKFRPLGAASWEGISLRSWFEHITGRLPSLYGSPSKPG